jgi:hypothetical protein
VRIGLDFDNTIVSYDALFYKVARERNMLPQEILIGKVAVRNYLRSVGQEDAWTELQGYVYGARMDEAAIYPGVIDFLRWAKSVKHELAIISHKTKHPYRGSQYDLHASARAWIEKHLNEGGEALLPSSQVYFEVSKEAKLARILEFGCAVFIDDLPEILTAEAFPKDTAPVLFDPDGNHEGHALPGVTIVRSWDRFARTLAR